MTSRSALQNLMVVFILIGVMGFVGTAGCGVYSASSGRVEEAIQRVSVKVLENRTPEPNLGVELSDAIILALQTDNTLKVVDEDSADCLIFGDVMRYNLREVATRSDLTVNEYQVQIAVVLTFEVLVSGEKVFEKKRFRGTGTYFLDDTSDTDETSAREQAAGEIVKDILAQVVEDW
ncbi:MAG: hypothetical protein KOO60_05630 [Gemmatimonadales bacterium]|nr:hypothetical protein [Gemmatimonadales bacterium]